MPDPEFPTYETFTYATKLKIAKVDEDGKALTGAKFALDGHSTSVMIVNEEIFTPDVNGEYWMRKDGTYTKTAPTPNDYFRPATPEDGRTGGYVLVEGVYTPATPDLPVETSAYEGMKTVETALAVVKSADLGGEKIVL